MVRINAKYASSDGQCFRVINTVEVEGQRWVHYRLEHSGADPREFRCWEQSFLDRFAPYINGD